MKYIFYDAWIIIDVLSPRIPARHRLCLRHWQAGNVDFLFGVMVCYNRCSRQELNLYL